MLANELHKQVAIHGVTLEDIQRILDNTVNDIKGKRNVGNGILMFDTSYLYNFHVNDMDYITKLCKLNRYSNKNVFEWHNRLERWYSDQTVRDNFGREIKPLQLVRNFDRIVNEGLEMVAECLSGGKGTQFNWHAIGDGDADSALPSDDQLVHQISRIDMTASSLGGSLSREGSTLYFVGVHPETIGSTIITETGVFDEKQSPDTMLDHSVFANGINHDQFEDSAGSTTVVYMCGV
jgi:hypothetical protein